MGGRVYRLFRQEHPEIDVADALDVKPTMAPALRRTVHTWVPDKLLCKRWGVPEPTPRQITELPSTKRQREYAAQVNAGLVKAKEGDTKMEPSSSTPGATFTTGVVPTTVDNALAG